MYQAYFYFIINYRQQDQQKRLLYQGLIYFYKMGIQPNSSAKSTLNVHVYSHQIGHFEHPAPLAWHLVEWNAWYFEGHANIGTFTPLDLIWIPQQCDHGTGGRGRIAEVKVTTWPVQGNGIHTDASTLFL